MKAWKIATAILTGLMLVTKIAWFSTDIVSVTAFIITLATFSLTLADLSKKAIKSLDFSLGLAWVLVVYWWFDAALQLGDENFYLFILELPIAIYLTMLVDKLRKLKGK